MGYLCVKKLSLGGKDYTPGEIIPDKAILGGRSGKLEAYGYISKLNNDEETSEATEDTEILSEDGAETTSVPESEGEGSPEVSEKGDSSPESRNKPQTKKSTQSSAKKQKNAPTNATE